MRPSRTVAGAGLAAALALGALPGLVGSHEPNQDRPIDAVAFRQVDLAAARDRSGTRELVLDAAGRSEAVLAPIGRLVDPARAMLDLTLRRPPRVSGADPSWTWKTPLYTVRGFATFYDKGTTAMRLPRGTVVVICGDSGCIERVITDYGPTKKGGRLIDLYRPDFFEICGCPGWSGTAEVTIRVY
jgi:hypothetical protein